MSKNMEKEISDLLKKVADKNKETMVAEPIKGEEITYLEDELDLMLPSKYKSFLKMSKGGRFFLKDRNETIDVYGFGYKKVNGRFMLDRSGTEYRPFQLYYGQAGVSTVDDPDDLTIGVVLKLDNQGNEKSREYFNSDSHYLTKATQMVKNKKR
jgi:hypothetical protein